jgi:hypothetical protein
VQFTTDGASLRRYVYSKVWPDNGKSSIDWLPREQCFTIKSADNEESEVDQMQELHFLAKKMNTMEEQLHVMSQNIAESFNQIHRFLSSPCLLACFQLLV